MIYVEICGMRPFGWYRALLANPQYRWVAILGSLIYLISPIDLSPDIIPLLGQIDDVILLSVLFSSVAQMLWPSLQSADPNSPFQSGSNGGNKGDDPNVRTVDVNATPID
ncbi:MAG: YkvA family protein [Leptolyngbyaceae bacterium]|nr:YkvA family protein [Leptolyngbyaceae bacterium]